MPKHNPIKIGEQIGRFTIINNSPKRYVLNGKKLGKYFICLCQCGTVKEVLGSSLRSKTTLSCGCLLKEINKKNQRLKILESSYNYLERYHKQSAKSRNLEFKLSRKELIKLIHSNCYWCGKEPSLWNLHYKKDGNRTKRTITITEEWASQQWLKINGIDRIDNNKGYVTDNVESCCTKCNLMKMDETAYDFLNHIKRIYEFQESKNG